MLPIGKKIRAKIIKFVKDPKIKIKLGNLDKYFEGMQEQIEFNREEYIE
jgi:hypothetical protein